VSNLPRDDAYGKNVNLLAKRLAYELEQPVALLFGDKQTRLAIPASSKLPNLEQPLTPHVAMLIPLEEIRILDFKKLDAQTLPIAKSFLRSAFQRLLMKNPKLWGNGRCYFWKRPLRVDGEIDIFEGFIFNIVPLEDGRLCVSLDITHKYVDKSWFLDRVDERDIARYRMRHFLYHFGKGPGISLSEFGKTRLQYLRNKKIGPLVTSPFDAQYIVLPESLPRAISDDLIERFHQTMEQFSPHPYRASRVIYEDADCNSLYRQVLAIQSAIEQARIRRGYLFLVLPENAKDGLHHYLKRDFWQDIQCQCALASNIKGFYFERRHNGKVTYQLRGETERDYLSYLLGAALGMYQVNRKWLWALASPLHYDVYIGIDVLNHTAGFTFVYQGAKFCYFRDGKSGQKEKLPARQIRSVILKHLREDIQRLDIVPNSIVIHRDGKWYKSESRALKAALDTLKRENILPSDVEVSMKTMLMQVKELKEGYSEQLLDC